VQHVGGVHVLEPPQHLFRGCVSCEQGVCVSTASKPTARTSTRHPPQHSHTPHHSPPPEPPPLAIA
jgi:hypothetical protein